MRIRARITGAVQGVGFRPHVFRMACKHGVAGFVLNSTAGVVIEAEAANGTVSAFFEELRRSPPPLARIASFTTEPLPDAGYKEFRVESSETEGEAEAFLPPDLAMCGDCRREIFDPRNRRCRYPFTTCTNCGPRYTIVDSLPYDRPRTTMRDFPMCSACEAEYRDPLDRRFHAQTNCCPACGPQIELWAQDGRVLARRDEALHQAAQAVREGRILALKGIGGFHLVCDARNRDALIELRRRKRRPAKPFAVMLPEHGHPLLHTPASPIVLVENTLGLPDEVAPGNPLAGVMIPYSPLHALLMAELGFPVVATSGNLTDEPICIDNREALERLGRIADLLLVHNRRILRPVDDSIVREIDGEPVVLRRARGYAPLPVEASALLPELFATGGHMKNTVAFSRGRRVFLSQHLGDLSTPTAAENHRRMTADFRRIYDVRPAAAACDLHPGYASTQTARELGVAVRAVQHHVAHLFSAVLEHRLTPPVFAASWDGTGAGPDGTVWGGEFLLWEGGVVRRTGHLRPFRLPGGEQAVREPRRSLLGVAWEMQRLELARPLFTDEEWRVLLRMLERGFRSPWTTSAGRLFDAAAALLGLCTASTFEGEAAMRVEFAARGAAGAEDAVPLEEDWAPLFERLADPGLPVAERAALLHESLAECIVRSARRAGVEEVVLTGGCFQNARLAEAAARRLRAEGFHPLLHREVPPNDGGLAAGQLLAAAWEVTLDVSGDPGRDHRDPGR
ncbi:MAG: carbamoyltransferase HypF [Bryobacteraceae bacterium]